ncbi:MAG TPA: YoaK family protein [Pseudolabrys sp.]|nr:YoaK family protein [Pseudolabrys sp.]
MTGTRERRIGIPRMIPFGMSLIAGVVDSVIFLALFGIYVAQATGSFVSIGAHWSQPEPDFLVKMLAIPVFLAGGIVAAAIVESMAGRRRAALVRTLLLEELLLLALLIAGLWGLPAARPDAPAAIAAALCGLAAMGLQSALVRLLIPDFGSTNVMTTNTTVVAIDLTHTVLAWRRRAGGREEFQKARRKLGNSLTVVVGFLAGTTSGAFGYHHFGWWALVVPLVLIDAVAAWIWFNTSDEATG